MPRYTDPIWSASALITIDTQRDTLDGGPLEVPGTSAALPKLHRLLGAFRQHGRPIVHVVRLYKGDGSNVDLCRREAVEQGSKILLAGSLGSELAPELLPQEDVRLEPVFLLGGGVQSIAHREVIIHKSRWSAFYGTPLEVHLAQHRSSTLVFCGCNFPNCPRASIYDASARDFRVVAVEDAISGFRERDRGELLNIGVSVATTEEVVRAVEQVGDVA